MIFCAAVLVLALGSRLILQADAGEKTVKKNELTADEAYVILQKGTERPNTGEYNNHFAEGYYACKQCDALLYRSDDKFQSSCGWPSFDDEIAGAVKQVPDADGRRIEIVCKNCGGHLGHVFEGEGLTDKNVRHCVNSIALKFSSADEVSIGEAVFAGGCFWGVEYYLQQEPGVLGTTVGFIGGQKNDPTYKEVCAKDTGHVEAVQVLFDPSVTSYEALARVFFEIHDPTQVGRQGPDVGAQYSSVIFYKDSEQKAVIEKLIKLLEDKGYDVVTKLVEGGKFWDAENYHQDYYQNNGKEPYCHARQSRF